MAPATKAPAVVLIAFGSISEPDPQQDAVERIAADVAGHLPGWTVRGATMAADGAIARAFDGLGPDAVVFPLLMADGWILRRVLADALSAAGRGDVRVMKPLGLLPEFHEICAEMIRAALSENGLAAGETTVVLAAQGARPTDLIFILEGQAAVAVRRANPQLRRLLSELRSIPPQPV